VVNLTPAYNAVVAIMQYSLYTAQRLGAGTTHYAVNRELVKVHTVLLFFSVFVVDRMNWPGPTCSPITASRTNLPA
jgi:hypothetical protein